LGLASGLFRKLRDHSFARKNAGALTFKVFRMIFPTMEKLEARGGIEPPIKVLQKLNKIRADSGPVEGFLPRVVELHMAHHGENGFEIGECGDGHGISTCEKREITLR
jgi:hypothetical protein